LTHAVFVAGVGVSVGLIASAGVSRWMSSLLFHVRPADPLTFAVTAAVILVTAVAASFLPAARATRVDPVQALRD